MIERYAMGPSIRNNEDLERYTYVSSRYFQERVPLQQIASFPIGPQIRALRRSIRDTEDASYRARKSHKSEKTSMSLSTRQKLFYDDILTVIFSFDGAQLYKNKKSDTWNAKPDFSSRRGGVYL